MMPVYEFERDDGNTVEAFFPIKKAPMIGQRITLNGESVIRIISMAVRTIATTGWPIKSDAAGVHPKQVNEAREHFKRCGVNTDFDPKTGQAIFRDANHRRRHLRATGRLRDLDGYN